MLISHYTLGCAETAVDDKSRKLPRLLVDCREQKSTEQLFFLAFRLFNVKSCICGFVSGAKEFTFTE